MLFFRPLSCALAALALLSLGVRSASNAANLPVFREVPLSDEGLPGAGPIRRYDWFKKLWEQKRAAWSKSIEADQGAVVFLGDSITQGWGEDLGGAFPGLKTANRGISGDTTRGVLIRLKEDVLDLNPKAVVLLIGTNDLEEQAAPETVAGNLKLILAALRRHNPNLPVVLCEVFPSSATQKRPVEQIKKLNQLYSAAVKGEPLITLIETWTLFADAGGNAKPEEFPDLLHPNRLGYAKWAAAVRPVLATLGFLESDADPFTPEPGFQSLFNGRDLQGWGYRPTSAADIQARANWQKNDPNAAAWPIVTQPLTLGSVATSPEGRFVARAGRLIVTTPAEGRRIQQLHTTREFSRDFVLRLEFRATPNADSGVYVRGPQLQCRDYPLAGPYKNLKKYKAQDWNELEISVGGGRATATCNGEMLEAEMKVPASGPIGVEGDRGQMEYRRIRIKEM